MSLTGLKLSQINDTQEPLKDTDLFYYVTQSPGPVYDSKKGSFKLIADYVDTTVNAALKEELILADATVKAHADTIVLAEKEARVSADAVLTQSILKEVTDRADAILAEKADRVAAISAESALRTAQVSTETANRTSADASLLEAISDEVSARAVSESAIIASIAAEETARVAIIATVQTSAATETLNRQNADTKLTTDLLKESQDRLTADNAEIAARTALEGVVTTLQAEVDKKAGLVDGKIPSALLPSYVDDVLESLTFAELPIEGETGKIYVVKETNLTYRWSGTTYVEISKSLALGETELTAYRGDYGKLAYTHSLIVTGNPHGTTKTDLGLGNVDNTTDALKPISTATQAALDLKLDIPAPIKHTTTGDYSSTTTRKALRLTDATDKPVTIDLATVPKNSGVIITLTEISANLTDKLTTKTVKQLLVFKDTAGVVTEPASTAGVSIASQVVSVVYKGIAAKVIKTLITINVEVLSEDNAVA